MIPQPEYREQIDTWVDAHKEEMLEDLKALVRIPSVRGDACGDMPYGEMCAKAVGAMKELMEKSGLRTTNYGNHCIAGDLDGEDGKALDILAHLDVVPVSDGWTKTDPFDPLIEGDRIYGRGTSDDKGPAVAALYAMRCVRELGMELKKGVRLICGSDEECGSQDLKYYYSREKEALYTFSPDADYPLINIEKGRLSKTFFASGVQETDPSGSGVRVLQFSAGDTSNIAPGKGSLVLDGISDKKMKEAARKTEEEYGGNIRYEEKDGRMNVRITGEPAHAAHPSAGINAATLALALLKEVITPDTPGEKLLLEIGKLWPHGDFLGKGLGVACADEESGSLTMSLDILRYETAPDGTSYRLEGTFDSRTPLCCQEEELVGTIRRRLGEAGCSMEEGGMVPAHYVSADSELVRKLLESYELYFGQKGEPIAIGGGTYVHSLERGVAFGCAVSEVDNRMHSDDEFMEIPVLILSAKIFADAILRLCG